jgi:hypothetical protein
MVSVAAGFCLYSDIKFGGILPAVSAAADNIFEFIEKSTIPERRIRQRQVTGSRQSIVQPFGSLPDEFILMFGIAHQVVAVFLNDQAFGFAAVLKNFMRMVDGDYAVGVPMHDQEVAYPGEFPVEIKVFPQRRSHACAIAGVRRP